MWAIGGVVRGIVRQWRAWREFRLVTGMWPLWSILANTLSVPVLFAFVVYAWIAALNTGREGIIFGVLFAGVAGSGAVFYGGRRLASKLDIARVGWDDTARLEDLLA